MGASQTVLSFKLPAIDEVIINGGLLMPIK